MVVPRERRNGTYASLLILCCSNTFPLRVLEPCDPGRLCVCILALAQIMQSAFSASAHGPGVICKRPYTEQFKRKAFAQRSHQLSSSSPQHIPSGADDEPSPIRHFSRMQQLASCRAHHHPQHHAACSTSRTKVQERACFLHRIR